MVLLRERQHQRFFGIRTCNGSSSVEFENFVELRIVLLLVAASSPWPMRPPHIIPERESAEIHCGNEQEETTDSKGRKAKSRVGRQTERTPYPTGMENTGLRTRETRIQDDLTFTGGNQVEDAAGEL